MQTLQNLYNQALTTIGDAPGVSDPSANTKATNILNLWFPVARHAVFTAAHWSSLKVIKRLARVSERDTSVEWANTDPAPGFRYAFALPSDMLQPQYLEDFTRFQLGRVGTERLLFSNQEFPVLNYTIDEATPIYWEPELYRCIIWTLAACINMAKNGKMALTQKLETQAADIISQAGLQAANSDDTYYDAVPSFYVGTGFSIPSDQTKYYYPVQSFRLDANSP